MGPQPPQPGCSSTLHRREVPLCPPSEKADPSFTHRGSPDCSSAWTTVIQDLVPVPPRRQDLDPSGQRFRQRGLQSPAHRPDEALRRQYEERGYKVTLESQNSFRLHLAGATISGRADVLATRDDELVIIDAKAAQPPGPRDPGHALHDVLQAAGHPGPGQAANRRGLLQPDRTVATLRRAADQEFHDLVVNLITASPQRRRPGRSPAPLSAGSAPFPGNTVPREWKHKRPIVKLHNCTSPHPHRLPTTHNTRKFRYSVAF